MELHNFIRGWLTVTTIASLGNCFQCLTDEKFLTNKIYDRIYRPEGTVRCIAMTTAAKVSLLYQRLFLLWQSYLVIMQLVCIIHYDSGPLYFVTLGSFLMIFTHFALETFLFRTASMNMGVIVNLVVSGLTVAFMSIAWHWLKQPKIIKEDFKSYQKLSRSKRAKME